MNLTPHINASTSNSHTKTLWIGAPDPAFLTRGIGGRGTRMISIVPTDKGGSPPTREDVPLIVRGSSGSRSRDMGTRERGIDGRRRHLEMRTSVVDTVIRI